MKRLSLPRSYFARMLLSLSIVFVLIISMISIAIYYNVDKVVSQTVENMSQKTLSQVSYSADYMHDSVRNTAYTLFNNANVIQYMYQKQIDYVDILQGVSQLRTWADTNSFIYSIYVYNKKIDMYMSTVGMDVAITNDQFFDQEISELMRQQVVENRRLMPIPRSTKLSLNGVLQNDEVDVFTYIIYDLQSADHEIQGAVVLNIKAEYLKNIIRSLLSKNQTDQSHLFIVDEKGEIIVGSDEGMEGNTKFQNDFIEKVRLSDSNSGNFKTQLYKDGKEMMVTYVTSDQLGWKFIEVVSVEQIYAPLYKIKWITIMVCSSVLVVGLLSAFLVSRQVASPIRQLVGRVTHLTKTKEQTGNQGELAFLSESFAATFQRNKYLDSEVKQHRKSEVLRNYLTYNGELSFHSLSSSFLDNQIRIDTERCYSVILLQIDHYDKLNQTFSRNDQSLLRYAIQNVSGEILGHYERLEIVDLEGEHMVILINPEEISEEQYLVNMKELLKQLQCWSELHLKISLTLAIGGFQKDITEVNNEYFELQHLIKYRFIYGYQSVIHKSMLPVSEFQHEATIVALEEKILAELTRGNFNEVIQSFEEMLLLLKSGTYKQIISALTHFIYVLNNRTMTLQNNSVAKFDIDYEYFTKEITEADTLDEVKIRFVLLFKKIVAGVALKNEGRGQLIIDNVVRIIEERYRDPNLSLNVIAEEIKMSKVYLGKVFRDAMGQSVSDYINEVRIQQVINEMQHSDLPVAGIMDKVGIENKSYFYTMFKKKIGVSVSDYRKRHLNQK
ncbi:AraC family transcriptional regulator [Paenibacillus agaridevorans]|nr:AraC family transcriptional regulator [Paenibacillus agaridevorans]